MKAIYLKGVAAIFFIFLLAGCNTDKEGKIENVGLLMSETINDQVWGTKGYRGLLQIASEYDVNVHFKEDIRSLMSAENAVKEFDKAGVTLLFGNGHEFAEYFSEIAKDYPHIHFVSINGEATEDNMTSLSFDGYAMGYFGGMVAAEMTESDEIGVIPAYEWQPEVKGFIDGAKYQNKNVTVHVSAVGDWNDIDGGLQKFEEQLAEGADIFYPAGDGFNVPIIEKVKENGLFVIGYVSDQHDLGSKTVLTSTVQHVDQLFLYAAENFNKGTLESGNYFFDFKDGAVTLGEFSSVVPDDFVKKIQTYVQNYIQSGKLPSNDN
ncbi:MAG: BMP family ABC transporter substrate-binding protein [Bacillus sp. (in: firmicutes)]